LQEREWLEWKYFRHPYGWTHSYKILENDDIVGAVALLPQAFFYQGRRIVGVQAVDGLMGREIRGKGLFNDVMAFLWRQPPKGQEREYFYLSFPSLPASVKAHAFAGWERLGDFALYSCVLNRRALRRLPGAAWTASVTRPLWPLVRRWQLASASPDVAVEEIDRFTEDLDRFFPPDRVRGDRSAAFLNWRVIDNPRDVMKAFRLRERGEIVGYVIVKVLERNLEIMDLKFLAPRVRYLASFLRHVIRQELGDSVDVRLLPRHPYRGLVRRVGFFRRRACGVLFVQKLELAGLTLDPAAWEINTLDSDW
jgi:hypothetical protein